MFDTLGGFIFAEVDKNRIRKLEGNNGPVVLTTVKVAINTQMHRGKAVAIRRFIVPMLTASYFYAS